MQQAIDCPFSLSQWLLISVLHWSKEFFPPSWMLAPLFQRAILERRPNLRYLAQQRINHDRWRDPDNGQECGAQCTFERSSVKCTFERSSVKCTFGTQEENSLAVVGILLGIACGGTFSTSMVSQNLTNLTSGNRLASARIIRSGILQRTDASSYFVLTSGSAPTHTGKQSVTQ